MVSEFASDLIWDQIIKLVESQLSICFPFNSNHFRVTPRVTFRVTSHELNALKSFCTIRTSRNITQKVTLKVTIFGFKRAPNLNQKIVTFRVTSGVDLDNKTQCFVNIYFSPKMVPKLALN